MKKCHREQGRHAGPVQVGVLSLAACTQTLPSPLAEQRGAARTMTYSTSALQARPTISATHGRALYTINNKGEVVMVELKPQETRGNQTS